MSAGIDRGSKGGPPVERADPVGEHQDEPDASRAIDSVGPDREEPGDRPLEADAAIASAGVAGDAARVTRAARCSICHAV